jgi:hypothetical protein
MTGDVITALAAIGAVAVLGLGYYRARPYGRLGLFAWLQSVSLMFPWLVFFGLFATGIYLDLVGILFLLGIDRRLRGLGPSGTIVGPTAE